MKAFDAGEPQASGKTYKVTGTLKQGITSEDAKKITKLIRDEGPKGVKTQIQGDEVRVTSKKRDDLQAVTRCSRAPTWTWHCSSSTTGSRFGVAPSVTPRRNPAQFFAVTSRSAIIRFVDQPVGTPPGDGSHNFKRGSR